jgi:hypothetical protein
MLAVSLSRVARAHVAREVRLFATAARISPRLHELEGNPGSTHSVRVVIGEFAPSLSVTGLLRSERCAGAAPGAV